VIRYFAALALTIVVEAIVVALLSRGVERGRLVRASLFINLFTHPLANLLFTGTTASFVAIEAGVVVVEAFLYASVERSPLRRAALLSLAANLASLGLSRLFT
jgi:hypothetical protein